jgi:hypothetical protein
MICLVMNSVRAKLTRYTNQMPSYVGKSNSHEPFVPPYLALQTYTFSLRWHGLTMAL